jgi:hypothetical protein
MSVVFRINGLHFYLSSPTTNSSGQCPTPTQQGYVDTWSEIDRRNAHVLHPLNSKYSSEAQNHFSNYYHQSEKNTNRSFSFNSYHSYHSRRRSSQPNDDQNYMDPSIYLNKYVNKPSSVYPVNNDPLFLFGNSIIKSNKADVLTIFGQRLANGDNTNTYVDKNGVIITEDGPFWPETYRILHPTPKLLSRGLSQEEFHLSPSGSSKKSNQIFTI